MWSGPSILLAGFALAFVLWSSGALSSLECEKILEKPGDFYVLGVFRICDGESFDIAAYVFAQAFTFIFTHSAPSHGSTLGYKLVTHCEQLPGCPEKILQEIERNHLEGKQTLVTVFNYGRLTQLLSRSMNVPQVNVDKSYIHFIDSAWKMNFQGALESLVALMKSFQWNLAGFIHFYDPEAIDLIREFYESDKDQICLEFTEKRMFDGKRLAEIISSSKSNVTVAIDILYIALFYIQTAITKDEASRITGKQFIQCCSDTFFQLAGFAPPDFNGVLSLFRRPRTLSGFRKYLLGLEKQRPANTTANYLYNEICHPCKTKASSTKPCLKSETSVTINTATGPFNRTLDNCTTSPVDICSECISNIADLDAIFMMHSLVNTLRLATEEMVSSHHPCLPQNGSSFNGSEYAAFVRNKYPHFLPVNTNPYDVYYWDIRADGDIVFLKVDIDLETGESQSFDPVARSIQLEDGRTITILPSNCLRVCRPGEKKLLHNDFDQLCCYECEACEPGTYSNGSAFQECWHCPQDEWSHQGEGSCWKKEVVYLFWTEPISVFFVLLSISGIALTVSVLALYVKHRDTPIVKAAGGLVFYSSMASLICSFGSVLLFFGEPTLWKCRLRRPVFGMSFAVCLSSILSKCVRILCAFASPVGRPTKLQAVLHQVILGTGPTLQLGIACFWLFLDPPGVHRTYPKNQAYIVIECVNEMGVGFSFLIGYLCFLAFVCLSVAIKGHTLPKTYNDSQGMSFVIMTFFAVWLSVLPVMDSGREKIAEKVCIVSILLSSFSCLAFLFFQKCYIILFRPEQNTSEWIKKSTFKYCQQIASKAELSIHLESSTASIDSVT